MKLSVVIVSWNTVEMLAACLSSIEREVQCLAPGSVETIVVDNASTDGSVALVRERFGWVRLIENSENVGFAAANNQAISMSQGEFVLLLNPDTEVLPGALVALIAFMSATPDAGAAGSHLLNPDGSLQVSGWPAITVPRELWRLLHLDAIRPFAVYPPRLWDTDTPIAVDSVQGASLAVRRETLNQVGLLDVRYFMYTEEIDLCLRIRNAGWRIYWLPASKVVHYGGQSTRQAALKMFLELYRSKVMYVRKHHGEWQAGVYKAVLVVTALVRLGLLPYRALRHDSEHAQYRRLAENYSQLVRNIGTY